MSIFKENSIKIRKDIEKYLNDLNDYVKTINNEKVPTYIKDNDEEYKKSLDKNNYILNHLTGYYVNRKSVEGINSLNYYSEEIKKCEKEIDKCKNLINKY